VTILVQGDCLKKTLSQYLVDRIRTTPNIRVRHLTEVVAVDGDEILREVTAKNLETDERTTFPTSHLFVCIGGVPRTEWAVEVGIQRDDAGYLLTGPDVAVNGNGKPD
jgi:thioredoxin reductase (NADPH)